MSTNLGNDAVFDRDAQAQSDKSDRSRRAVPDTRPADTIDSRTIFGTGKEVAIRHGDQVYRLRITRHGRLILNK
ncbi:MAG: hemin uptake protein HemP [Sedimentisphaerales bacterium]|nr:hemin uptake protein HemP [Sedimentisphaerales bacterium]